MTLIQDTRKEQAQRDPDSQECADLECVIAGVTDVVAGLQKNIKALKAPQPEMVTHAQ